MKSIAVDTRSCLTSHCTSGCNFLLAPVADTTRQLPDEQRLLTRLMRSYESGARPVVSANSSVTVEFGFTLIQIMDMVRISVVRYVRLVNHLQQLFFQDEKNQVLTTNVWLEHVSSFTLHHTALPCVKTLLFGRIKFFVVTIPCWPLLMAQHSAFHD